MQDVLQECLPRFEGFCEAKLSDRDSASRTPGILHVVKKSGDPICCFVEPGGAGVGRRPNEPAFGGGVGGVGAVSYQWEYRGIGSDGGTKLGREG